MSTYYDPLTPIQFADLFDGRLSKAGVHEHIPADPDNAPTASRRCLTDGHDNYLWVYAGERGFASFTRYFPNGNPHRILRAISDEFDVEIVSEHDPRYWGYETREEWVAAEIAEEEKSSQKFYDDVARFIRGESHGISPGTIGIIKAEIAKRLVAETPGLLDEESRPELKKAVETIYEREHPPVVVKFSQQEWDAMAEMAIRGNDGEKPRPDKHVTSDFDISGSLADNMDDDLPFAFPRDTPTWGA